MLDKKKEEDRPLHIIRCAYLLLVQ